MEDVDEVVREETDSRGRVTLGKDLEHRRVVVAYKVIGDKLEDTRT